MPLPPIHEGEFGRYVGRGSDLHAQAAELEWRHQNERRHQFSSRDRHPPPPPPQLAPLPPPHSHYDIEMANARGQPPCYPPHPHQQPYPPGMPIGPLNSPISMHQQQRSSPKYDRHGNLIVGMFKERGNPAPVRLGPMDHHSGMSPPPRSFMPPGSMLMHPGHEMQLHEMPSMRPASGMYPPQRWHDNLEQADFPPPHARMLPESSRFSPVGSRRYPQQQPPQPMLLLNSSQGQPNPNHSSGDSTRYAKWRERRDVITTLDRETAQSSSRTDSLKSTLQQQDNRINANRTDVGTSSNTSKKKIITTTEQVEDNTEEQKVPKEATNSNSSASNERESSLNKETPTTPKTKPDSKTEPQDISDGEIVDDEDSSDDSETVRPVGREAINDQLENHHGYLSGPMKTPIIRNTYTRNREPHQYYDTGKKRRLIEREDYSMDYETISDEDLDDFMGDKKISDIGSDDPRFDERLRGSSGRDKSLSEIELLNALGLDWANLVELAKQSKTSSKETYASSAVRRFSMPNYLPTLGITPELAGQELYAIIMQVCRS